MRSPTTNPQPPPSTPCRQARLPQTFLEAAKVCGEDNGGKRGRKGADDSTMPPPPPCGHQRLARSRDRDCGPAWVFPVARAAHQQPPGTLFQEGPRGLQRPAASCQVAPINSLPPAASWGGLQAAGQHVTRGPGLDGSSLTHIPALPSLPNLTRTRALTHTQPCLPWLKAPPSPVSLSHKPPPSFPTTARPEKLQTCSGWDVTGSRAL